jgi:uncharacterized protein YkwD
MKPMKKWQGCTLTAAALIAMIFLTPRIRPSAGQIPFHLQQSQNKVIPVKNLSSQVEDSLFGLTNDQRLKKKRVLLIREELLVRVARAHSQDMLKRNYLSHFSPEGKSVVDRYAGETGEKTIRRSLGENLHTIESSQGLRDPNAIAQVMIKDWMGSSSHRKNIFSKNYEDAGVGCASDGSRIFCTEVFAGPK